MAVHGKMLICLGALSTVLLIPVFAAEHEHDYGKPLWNATYTDMLKRDLLATYDKFARPSHHNNVTKVTMDLDLKHVDLDDSKSLFTVNAWAVLTWRDEKLQWNASEYGGLKELHLADHEIWEPDIVLYNGALGNNIDHYGNTHCLASPNGDVLWVPPSQFVVFCELDLRKWPWDQHTCTLRLGSWTYNGQQVDLQIKQRKPKDSIKLDVKMEWNVINITKRRQVSYYSCCPEPYIDLDFAITVERRASAYRPIVVAPALSTLLLSLSSMWLPPFGRERYILSSLGLLLSAIFLLHFSIWLPAVSINTPLIIIFYAYIFMMLALSIVVSILTYCLSSSEIRLPRCMLNFLRGQASTFLLLPQQKTHGINYSQDGYEEESGAGVGEELREYELGDHVEQKRILKRKEPKEGWTLVAAALDRLFFLVSLLLLVSFSISALL